MPGANSFRHRSAECGWSAFLAQPVTLKLVDLGLLAILLVAPFFMGGRQALGQIVLCGLSSLTAAAWCLYQWRRGDGRWRFTGVEPILLLGLGLIVLQCWQLSPEMLQALSPRVPQLLPEWDAGGNPLLGQRVWRRISLTPYETWSNFVVIVACVQYFFVAAQRLRTLDELNRYVQAVAVGAAAMAGFGIAQLIWGNGKFFWIYAHPMTDTRFVAKGAFTNANHFANFLAMAVPAQLYCLVQYVAPQSSGRRGASRHGGPVASSRPAPAIACWIAALAVTMLAILLSMSRGGIVCSLGGILIALLVFWRKGLLGIKLTAIVSGLAVASLAATLLFGDLAAKMVEQNFVELTSSRIDQLDQNNSRRKIWESNVQGIREFPLAGTGLGSHHEVYWRWFNYPHDGKEYSHAENGPLQVALETGLTGLGIVLLLSLTALLWCAQGVWNATSLRAAGLIAVASAGLLVNLAHSVTDFVWYVPACMNVVLLYAVCAWRVSLMRFTEGSSAPVPVARTMWSRLSWATALPAVLGLGVWMALEKLPEVKAEPLWQEYLRLTLARQQEEAAGTAPDADPSLEHRLNLVLAAADADPHAHRVQLYAGIACLRQFALSQQKQNNFMPLAQIRDAARTLFTSPQELNEWLARPGVIGAGREYLQAAITHFEASLQACPLQPRPYLELAELVWLNGGTKEQERELIEQAVAVRPYDARAQFALGRDLWLEGDQQEGLAHWKEAFRLDADYRGHLIGALSGYVPARFFLDNFDPDHASLRQLRVAYRTSEDRAGYLQIVDALARSSVEEAVAASDLTATDHWLLAHECFAELGDRKSAYHSAREAIASNPSSYPAHQMFALWLYQNGAYREAVEQLTWCARHKPDVEWLTTMARDALIRAERGDGPPSYAEGPGGGVRR